MGIKRDIEYAIYIHGAWKTQFRNFLSGRAPMDLSAVGGTQACKLGHWLDNEARRMLSPEDHAEACRLHVRFHEIAGEIVRNIKQKDFATARASLNPTGPFDQASQGLATFLRKMPLRQRARADSSSAETEERQAA
ncbi:MAG: CZB domain-containing protein [Hydrogenophilales bacterium]|nr:CZB domain-containing protein [Hydrogenophilales bacterium]